jgi:hypothetical protein
MIGNLVSTHWSVSMPLKTPERFQNDMIRWWIEEGRKEHAPIFEWLADPSVERAVSRYCNKLLTKYAQDAVRHEISRRGTVASVTIPLRPAASNFFSKVPPAAHQLRLPSGTQVQLSASFVQNALEAAFLDQGYRVVDGKVSFDIELPEEDDLEDEEEEGLEDEGEPEGGEGASEDLVIEDSVEYDDADADLTEGSEE